MKQPNDAPGSGSRYKLHNDDNNMVACSSVPTEGQCGIDPVYDTSSITLHLIHYCRQLREASS